MSEDGGRKANRVIVEDLHGNEVDISRPIAGREVRLIRLERRPGSGRELPDSVIDFGHGGAVTVTPPKVVFPHDTDHWQTGIPVVVTPRSEEERAADDIPPGGLRREVISCGDTPGDDEIPFRCDVSMDADIVGGLAANLIQEHGRLLAMDDVTIVAVCVTTVSGTEAEYTLRLHGGLNMLVLALRRVWKAEDVASARIVYECGEPV